MTANHILTKHSNLQIIKASFYGNSRTTVCEYIDTFMNAAPNTSLGRISTNNLISKVLIQNKRDELQESSSGFA